MSTECWNVPSAMQSPKDILINRYNSWCEIIAVSSLLLFSSLVCQCRLLASSMESTAALPSESINLFIRRVGLEFRL